MKKILFTAIVVMLVAAFGISAFMVGSYLIDGKKQAERNEELSEIVANAQTDATTIPETTEPAAPQETTAETTEATQPTEEGGMLAGYKEIYEMNNDVVGWIKMEGTKMDYPVMQTPSNPNYYLYRDFDKKDSKRGSIYAKEDCDINAPSDNITLFGHNMQDGSMFACLGDYTSKRAWENNSLIYGDKLICLSTCEYSLDNGRLVVAAVRIT